MHCQNCFSEIQGKVIYCPICNLPHHENCWKKNNFKCSGFNCKGTTITDSQTEEPQQKNIPEEAVPAVANSNENIEQNFNSTEREVKFRIAKKESSIHKILIIGFIIFAIGITLFLLTFKKNKNIEKVDNSPVITSSPSPTETSGEIVILPDPDEVKKTPVTTSTPTQLPSSVSPTVEPTQTSDVIPNDSNPESANSSPSTEPATPSNVIESSETKDNIELNTEDTDKIKNTILSWRDQKTKIFVSPDENNHEIENLLTGKALKDVQKAIKWLGQNNAYREITPRTLKFTSITKNNDGSVEVIVDIAEKSDYFEKGKLLTKNSYDHDYKARYILENSNNNWLISNIRVVK